MVKGFSYIRAISCIAIIVLHVTFSSLLLFKDEISLNSQYITNMITNNLMWAVPCFVMVTGALLLDEKRNITIKKIYTKYISRILFTLFGATLLFSLFEMVMDDKCFTFSKLAADIKEMIIGKGWSHLWYLYLLLGLYVLLPFYRKISSMSNNKELLYLLIVYLVFVSILPLFKLINLDIGFYIHVSTIYPFYLFTGYFVIKRCLDKISLKLATVMFIVPTITICALTYISMKNGYNIGALWGYSSIFVIMQSIGIFLFIYKFKGFNAKLLDKVLVAIDGKSFGIYIIHMIFVRLILRYNRFNPYKYGVLGFVGVCIVVFLISYIIMTIVKAFSKIRKKYI